MATTETILDPGNLCEECGCIPCQCHDDTLTKCPECGGCGLGMEGWNCEFCDGAGELDY
jgi:hypothetical protein